ncbi:SDR family NAD(P)-dependent oxidoreductase [Winogradskyella sp. 3972H.M.0a.05]|uniref:polysaccharide biosynthesis protein n=1 Tax=Winogradskyella sp. 3972H.M.0a.05 TaxID=2950277 RepID=UPI003395C31A
MLDKYLNKTLHKYASKWLILAIDVAIVLFSFFLAYVIRYNFKLDFDPVQVLKQIPLVIVVSVLCFMLVGTHKTVVRYIGFRDVVNIFIGANLIGTVLILFTYLSRKFGFDKSFEISGSIIYINLLLNLLFLTGFKFFIKSYYRKLMLEGVGTSEIENVLIYGAGDSGMITYEALSGDLKSNLKVVGFVDDNEVKVGKKIDLLRVYSPKEIDEAFVKNKKIKQVIISIQNIEPILLLSIINGLFELKVKVKIVPPVKTWIDGDLSVGQIKDVNIEDLLGREPIVINNPAVIDEYDNKVILITGAAGSIGSEIARKIAKLNFKKLVLIDNAESPLYDIQQELKQKNIDNVTCIIADVRRKKSRLDEIFSKYKPEIVFHAAAYKHVPLMETYPHEAVSVNVFGTANIANLSIRHGVEKFVLISTDKAVNPTNVMGATKRIAELYVNCVKGMGKTKFITTRFGNVLGSNGSVIPLFKKQIEAGGPLTVTHKDVTRYFMTIPEACQLVLEAATMGNGGEIFVFDMGKSVKIFDLAKNMIILSGLRYPEDIKIKITGLRPGEKIYEELLANEENTKPTYHEKIMIAKSKHVDISSTISKINVLCEKSSKSQLFELVALIKDLVPEYVSNNSKFEILDKKSNQP